MHEELFPLRIADGKRFCNRQVERKQLAGFLQQKRPTVLISPRRYGKTSLAYKVTKDAKFPFCAIDFLTAYDDDSLCATLLEGVSTLISHIMPVNMKTIQLLEKCFHGLKAVIRYKFIELEVAHVAEKSDPVRQILDALRGLENLATKLKITVVIFIDEFQRVLETERSAAIQGAIRNVAQSSKHVAFLFSGSSRHMLSQAFDDPNQPLYMMCEKMFIHRISAEDYEPYIQDAAEIQWGKPLEASIINRIIELSERHPFYVNYLCSKLWQNTKLPTHEDSVDKAWHECLISEERRLIAELEKLTLNQRLILREIARTSYLKEPTGAHFLTQVKMSSGTLTPALNALRKKDMVYTDEEGVVKVLDPLMKSFLCA